MKKYLYRVENLLLIVPIVLFVVYQPLLGNSVLDIHLHDTYFVMDSTFLFNVGFVFLFILYFLHFILKASSKRNILICKMHVYSTILLQITGFILLGFTLSWYTMPKNYFDFTSMENYRKINRIYATLIFIFFIIQLGFLAHFFIAIFKKPSKKLKKLNGASPIKQ